MPITSHTAEIVQWHARMGGHKGPSPAPHALRMLREMVELCLAAEASPDEIIIAAHAELTKQNAKQEKLRKEALYVNVTEELVDVVILGEILYHYWGSSFNFHIQSKLETLWSRAWMTDEYGVLWRDLDKS